MRSGGRPDPARACVTDEGEAPQAVFRFHQGPPRADLSGLIWSVRLAARNRSTQLSSPACGLLAQQERRSDPVLRWRFGSLRLRRIGTAAARRTDLTIAIEAATGVART